ncbi:GNAT family N-acetyltransferase [Flavobacteriaceae bacterium KMM 6898]|nr:GNAT family N-acetyltransferase [Flavobacteriaceae bacterium KMM 6898]
MRIISNPFTSKTFSDIWLRQFNKNQPYFEFKSIEGISFVKSWLPLLYVNIGKTHTKGISYTLNEQEQLDLKNKVLLIYDVPSFFDLELPTLNKNSQLHKIQQYPGFLIQLDNFNDLSHYMVSNFSKSSRYKLNKYKKRLEDSFDISYKMFLGDISKEEYDFVFEHFKILLEKRFLDKGITNNNLDPKEWDFYYEVAFPMILEKKASLFVIYEGNSPIGVTLSYFSENILFDAITVFDIDYEKFHLGSVTTMKLVEWSLKNNIRTFDFSKGYFDYKKRWANKEYRFEYHVYHDSNSISAKLIAWSVFGFFTLKQKLRDKKIIEKLQKLRYHLKSKKVESTPNLTYEFSDLKQDTEELDLVEIDFKTPPHTFLTALVFDFLYLNNEELKHIRVQQVKNNKSLFIIRGKSTNRIATITSLSQKQ